MKKGPTLTMKLYMYSSQLIYDNNILSIYFLYQNLLTLVLYFHVSLMKPVLEVFFYTQVFFISIPNETPNMTLKMIPRHSILKINICTTFQTRHMNDYILLDATVFNSICKIICTEKGIDTIRLFHILLIIDTDKAKDYSYMILNISR